jgi:hypothetical protein
MLAQRDHYFRQLARVKFLELGAAELSLPGRMSGHTD